MNIELNKMEQLEDTIHNVLKYTNYAKGYIMAKNYNLANVCLDNAQEYLIDLSFQEPKLYNIIKREYESVKKDYEDKRGKK